MARSPREKNVLRLYVGSIINYFLYNDTEVTQWEIPCRSRPYPASDNGVKVKKVKSSMARSLPVENLLPQNVESIINYLQSSTEVAQSGTPSCSRPQPAMDNGVKDGRSNWLVALLTLMGSTPWAPYA